MAKLIHEVWETGDGCSMFRRDVKGWRENLKPPVRLLHTFEAESAYEAFNRYYQLMGWGEWKPLPGFLDEPYPD